MIRCGGKILVINSCLLRKQHRDKNCKDGWGEKQWLLSKGRKITNKYVIHVWHSFFYAKLFFIYTFCFPSIDPIYI